MSSTLSRANSFLVCKYIYKNPIPTKNKVLVMIVFSETSEDCNVLDCFRLWRMDPLERRRNTTSHHPLRLIGRLVESQEGLETKVGLRADLVGAPRSLAWFFVIGDCVGYEIERSVEAALTCLDSLRLPSCIRTPYVGSSVGTFKITKENNITKAHTRGLTECSRSRLSISSFFNRLRTHSGVVSH
ncbi:hypothetical protein M9H77_03710 [Catharanthus roseus]|uniref:Uncharacterized protein n=1 Tax=Catharanthus roseus TaxID=4058 RepID=A0ACC0CCA9_CATRO|nr:hypothetical protein M9H77_03710 [Catharanthus roseus]